MGRRKCFAEKETKGENHHIHSNWQRKDEVDPLIYNF